LKTDRIRVAARTSG